MANWYVIDNGGKKMLVKQHSSDTSAELVCKTQDNELLSIKRTQILATLPSKPAYGRVFGVLIEPLLKVVEHPYFGEVRLYRNNKGDLIKLKKAMDNVASRLSRVKINLGKEMDLSAEFRNNAGKKAGMFSYRGGKEGSSGTLLVSLPEGSSQGAFDYVVAHESGHGVWFGMLSQEQKARWVALFARQAKLQNLDPVVIQEARKHFMSNLKSHQFETVADYRSMVDDKDDYYEAFDLALGNVLSTYRLKEQHLNSVLHTLGGSMFQACWPKSCQTSEFEIPVTEYGTKNPDELFAEAFTFWLFGNKLNERVDTLMTKTIGATKLSAVKVEQLPEGLMA